MRLLFASIGKPNCHICGKPISHQSLDQIVDLIAAYPENTRVIILAPVVRDRKGEFKKLFETYLKRGYIRARVDGEMRELEEDIRLSKTRNHSVDVVVDRVLIKTGIRRRLELSVKAALELAEGLVTVSAIGLEEKLFSERQACVDCGISIPTLEPRSFSFNSRHGACPDCGGMGTQMTVNPENLVLDPDQPISALEFSVQNARIAHHMRESLTKVARKFKIDGKTPFAKLPAKARDAFLFGSTDPGGFWGIDKWLQSELETEGNSGTREEVEKLFSVQECSACKGSRLQPECRAVKINSRSISDYARLSLENAQKAFREIILTSRESQIAGQILREIQERTDFLLNVGVGYLSLDRPASTLSGEGTADPSRHSDRVEIAWRSLCSGRAFDRFAPQG
jgi:excinuclease ABC subunit A